MLNAQQTLSDIHAIDDAIREGGIAAGMRAILLLDPSAGLRVRYDTATDPIFAPALQAYETKRRLEYQALENSPAAIAWYRRRFKSALASAAPE
jgi:hypothetical protein